MFHYKVQFFLSVFIVAIKQSSQSPIESQASKVENVDVDISCVANATCVQSVSNKVVRALHMRKAINFGGFIIEPRPNAEKVEGRSVSKLWDLARSNTLRVPIGAYSLSLQKSEEYENYLEVAVEGKKAQNKQLSNEKQPERPERVFFKAFEIASLISP